MYLKNSPALLKKMQQAASTGDNDLLRNSAHSLKSASANLGRDGRVAQALGPLGGGRV
jgi:HPt (histidine-containing phosphotransfer) domain-containing protein